jgi:hypothetical protein
MENGTYYRRRADELLDARLELLEERFGRLEEAVEGIRSQLARWAGALLVVVALASMFGSSIADALFRVVGK